MDEVGIVRIGCFTRSTVIKFGKDEGRKARSLRGGRCGMFTQNSGVMRNACIEEGSRC